MKRISILICAFALFCLAACQQEKDTRYFAPEIAFENGSYAVKSADGGLDVAVSLSRPATQALTVNVNIESSLQEELQFKLSSHSLSIAEGSSTASLHITLVDDEIWDTESWIDLILAPGTRYTLNPDGAWNGNTQVDLGQSSEGSNYLRNFRNMYDHPSFSCKANASVSQMFRLSDLFPNYVYPSPVAILDYGNDQGHREFSPADSLLRFVLDKGETMKGGIYLTRPQSFTAYIGTYADWQADETGGKAWVVDSRATGGVISASKHKAITGTIPASFGGLEKCGNLQLNGNKLKGVVPAEVQAHANWKNDKWKVATNILPQQEGYGLTTE